MIKKDEVCNSLALRDFLAYEGDANIAFVKKANEVPRIDKVIFYHSGIHNAIAAI